MSAHQPFAEQDPGKCGAEREHDEEVAIQGGFPLPGGSPVAAEDDQRRANGRGDQGGPAEAVEVFAGEDGCSDAEQNRHGADHERRLADCGVRQTVVLDQKLDRNAEEGGDQQDSNLSSGKADSIQQSNWKQPGTGKEEAIEHHMLHAHFIKRQSTKVEAGTPQTSRDRAGSVSEKPGARGQCCWFCHAYFNFRTAWDEAIARMAEQLCCIPRLWIRLLQFHIGREAWFQRNWMFPEVNIPGIPQNLKVRQAVQDRASICGTVRSGRCHAARRFSSTFAQRKEDANMRSTFISKAMTFLPLLLLVSVLHAQPNDATSATPGMSKVRIVRLSMVRGSVQIDRSDGRGNERAIANLPIVEKNELRTGEGIAEIEFEDNSSLRLAPNSQLEFVRLERSASGATVSSVHLVAGTAYLSLVKPQNSKAVNQFALMFGDRTLNLEPATHIRLSLEGPEAKLAVLDGVVRVDEAGGQLSIPKKKTAIFQISNASEPTVTRNVETSPFDGWDHDATTYHAGAAAFSAFSSPYAYGLRDLSYYGSFVNAGGCGGGSMWRPYFASAAWDPFANGTWAWYPGAGYSWVSPYPWAWMPYHSGSWAYCGDAGWGWFPGEGNWYGLNNVAALTPIGRTVAGGRTQPPNLPHHPPPPHAPSMIAINTKPIAVSQIASATKFEFRKDSAGLGVPRGTLGNLNKFSRDTISHGTASTAVYASVPRTGQTFGSVTNSQMLATSIHRGYAPAPSSSSESSFGSSYAGSSGNGGGMRGGGSTAGPTLAPSAPSMPSGGGGAKK